MSLLQRNGHEKLGSPQPPTHAVTPDPADPGAAEAATPPAPRSVELIERPTRRRFTSEYKLALLREADAAAEPGEIGALLRREGLYSSHLSTWRRQRDEGALLALSRPRGRTAPSPLEQEMRVLRRRLEKAEKDLATAKIVIEVQGKVSALLDSLLAGSATDDKSTDA